MARHITGPPPLGEQRFAMSYEQFLDWADADEDIHAEWVDGEVIVFMPPGTTHQRIGLFLSTLLSLYARFFKLGEVLVAPYEMLILPGKSSREPDILFIAREHQDRVTAKRLDGPADLIVEIISDSSVTRDREEKFREYEGAGVREYWLLDSRPGRRQARFYQLTDQGRYREARPGEDGYYHAAMLPGFRLRPDWLWQDPLPDPLVLLAEIAPDALRAALGATSSGGGANSPGRRHGLLRDSL